MTGQDGGFRAAAARFRAEVEAALTRARRASAEARAQSAEFRRGNEELAARARTGPPRGAHPPTTAEPRAEAEKFRRANDLPVDDPAEDAPAPPREDEDFSQHKVLFDLDAPDDPAPGDHVVDQTSDQSEAPDAPGIDSPPGWAAGTRDDDEDFSQQRILIDATADSYRPEPAPDSVFDLPDEQNPS